MAKTKFVCMYCGAGIAATQIDNALKMEEIECPKCGEKTVFFRGKSLKKSETPDWKYDVPKAVVVRKFRQKAISGELFNGMPFVERDGIVWVWKNSGYYGSWKWIPCVRTREEFVKNYRYCRSYVIDGWRFEVEAKKKNSEIELFSAKQIGENANFAPVIAEAAKYGFNVTAEFLFDQVKNIELSFKQNRFLPDGSGQVFSPIKDNGTIFRFSKIDNNAQEYVV